MSCDMVPYLRYEKSSRVHHFFALILSVRLAMSCDMVPYLRYEKSSRVHHFFALILSVRLAMSCDMVPHLRYEKSCRVHHFFAGQVEKETLSFHFTARSAGFTFPG